MSEKNTIEIIIRGPMASGKTALAHYLSKLLAQLWKIEVKVEDAPGDMETRDGFTPEQRRATLNAVRDKTAVKIRTEQTRRDHGLPKGMHYIIAGPPVTYMPSKSVVLMDVRPPCDCGAAKCRTTHADWCSTRSKP